MMTNKMEALAKIQTRFLGIDSARNGVGITVSYRKNREAIKQWEQQTDHLIIQNERVNQRYMLSCENL